MGEIWEIESENKKWGEKMTCQDAEQRIKDSFQDQAYLYLELDNKVLLGRYEGGEFQFYGSPLDDGCVPSSHKEAQSKPAMRAGEWSSPTLGRMWESIQRVIVFTKEQELRLCRTQAWFYGRLRRDCPCGHTVSVIDEEQKIWGSIQQGTGKWHMVESRRGSRIWVPAEPEVSGKGNRKGKSMGVLVRKYFEFPDATEGRGLAVQIDERMVGIYPWIDEEGSV